MDYHFMTNWAKNDRHVPPPGGGWLTKNVDPRIGFFRFGNELQRGRLHLRGNEGALLGRR